MITAATGIDGSKENLSNIALNVAAKAREFNRREGMTPDDETLAPAFFTPLKDSGAAITRDEMDFMFNDYQKIRNWADKR